MKKLSLLLMSVILVFSLAACAKSESTAPAEGGQALEGMVKIDGSSTVYPITQAVAEDFMNNNPKVQVTVGVSGSGGGFKKFTVGETDISDASRTIKDKEVKIAEENNIKFIEIPVAYDGLSVVVNKDNDFVDYLTVDELKKIWEPESKVKTWSQVRAGWPNEEIKLYGPGTDSGTFDYFTEEIVGEGGASRSDYTASEDDNVLVQGIIGDKYSLGYFGYAYYVENKDQMKIVPVDSGNGPVEPNNETVESGKYSPLSRPLFIYVSTESLKKPEVYELVKFYLNNGAKYATEVGYVGLPSAKYEESLKLVEENK